jgi:hypothetical protein
MIEPKKILLSQRTRDSATVIEAGSLNNPFIGRIQVLCTGPQAFAEILNYLVHADLAIGAVQHAISCLQMARRPEDRIDDMRMLQDAHHTLTGWHFDSASTPAPLRGIRPSAGSISWEKAKEVMGQIDPAKVQEMFGGNPLRLGSAHPDEELKIDKMLPESVPSEGEKTS